MAMGSLSENNHPEHARAEDGVPTQVFNQLRDFANKAIEKSPLLQTGVARGKDLYTQFAATKAGGKVTQLVSGLQSKAVLVEESWFAAVDAILTNGRATFKAGESKVHHAEAAVKAYYAELVDQFLALHARVLEGDAHIDKHEYIARVRQALNTVWDESLREPVGAFYARASEKLPALKRLSGDHLSARKMIEGVRTELGTAWEETSHKALNLAMRPSRAIYSAAVHAYTTGLEAGSQIQLRQHEFVQTVRQQLGDKWTEKLEAPLTEFYLAAKNKSVSELRAVHAALDSDGDGTVTVGDAVNTLQTFGSRASTRLLRTTQSAMDRVLPTDQEQQVAGEPTLGYVAGDLSKRLETRIKPAAEKASGTLRRVGLGSVDNALRFLLAFTISMVTSPLVTTTATGVRQRAESVLARASAWLETLKPRPLVSLPRDFFLYVLAMLRSYIKGPAGAASPPKQKRVIVASVAAAAPVPDATPVAEPAPQANGKTNGASSNRVAQEEVDTPAPSPVDAGSSNSASPPSVSPNAASAPETETEAQAQTPSHGQREHSPASANGSSSKGKQQGGKNRGKTTPRRR